MGIELGIQHSEQQVNLESIRQKALRNLDHYLKTPTEIELHQHQADAILALRDFLADGETAGYFSLPCGSGKTIVALELIKALGLKTAILSPYAILLEQTQRRADEFAPGLDVTNYYANEKDLNGRVLNTTYRSMGILIQSNEIEVRNKLAEVELIICDEMHKGLGEDTHKIFRQFPNAILIGLSATPYSGQLDGYQRRGIVKKDEPWLGLFQECIYEMSMEEAMERGVIAPVDINLLRTNITVQEISIIGGDYNQSDLEKYLGGEARDYLTLATVAGLEYVPANIHFTPSQTEHIKAIHQAIKGKKTLIFGRSIEHVEKLREMLESSDVAAEVVHSRLDQDERNRRLLLYEKGYIKVLLGVRTLQEGFDSPDTEVGIFTTPTHSGIVALQQFGRILRPVKNRAIAVQLVDDFAQRLWEPILLTDLFDPHFILRGTQTGEKPRLFTSKSQDKKPLISIQGMDLGVIVDRSDSKALLRHRIKRSSLEQISRALDLVISESYAQNPNSDALTIYQKIADAVPFFIPSDKANEALQALGSIDTNTANLGRKVFTLLHMKTILSAVKPYLGENREENNEIIQTALTEISDRLVAMSERQRYIMVGLFELARQTAEKYISQREGVPIGWIKAGYLNSLRDSTGEANWVVSEFESNVEVKALAAEVAQQSGIDEIALRNRIISRPVPIEQLSVNGFEDRVMQILYTRQFAKEVLEDYLSPRQAICIMRNFGLGEFDSPQTHEQIAEVFCVSGPRIQQIVQKAEKSIKQACFRPESWLAGFGRTEKGLDVIKPYKRNIDYRFDSFDFTESYKGLLIDSALPNRIVMVCLGRGITRLEDLKTLVSKEGTLGWLSGFDFRLVKEYFQIKE